VNRAWKLLRDSGELRVREEVWTGIYNSKAAKDDFTFDFTRDFMSRAEGVYGSRATKAAARSYFWILPHDITRKSFL